MANRELYRRIDVVYNENHEVYGSPRIYQEFADGRHPKDQDLV